jgi:hypothetical protein
MSIQSLLLAALPGVGLNMTTDFAPLFVGLVVGVCLCVLAVAFILGLYDSGWLTHQRQPSPERSVSAPELPDAV